MSVLARLLCYIAIGLGAKQADDGIVVALDQPGPRLVVTTSPREGELRIVVRHAAQRSRSNCPGPPPILQREGARSPLVPPPWR